MTSKLKSISLSNRINRSPVLNLPVFGIVQPDASKETEKNENGCKLFSIFLITIFKSVVLAVKLVCW